MRPLLYSINVTLDGCCDHRAAPADEVLQQTALRVLHATPPRASAEPTPCSLVASPTK
jgi:hypothetical protein